MYRYICIYTTYVLRMNTRMAYIEDCNVKKDLKDHCLVYFDY